MADPAEQELLRLFFADPFLSSTLASLCQTHANLQDPLTTITVSILTIPVRIQLTETGLQPFQGKDWTIPYFHMLQEQREFLLRIISDTPRWLMHDKCIIWKRQGAPQHPSTLDILSTMCIDLLRCEAYKDRRSRLALCNIILQRVQALVPISQAIQAELNLRVFQRPLPSSEGPSPE